MVSELVYQQTKKTWRHHRISNAVVSELVYQQTKKIGVTIGFQTFWSFVKRLTAYALFLLFSMPFK